VSTPARDMIQALGAAQRSRALHDVTDEPERRHELADEALAALAAAQRADQEAAAR
jgi:hypothetical protein